MEWQQNYWSTHMQLLHACLRFTDGPILEMGMGLYSTSVVSSFVFGGRFARSAEAHDAEWFGYLEKMNQKLEPSRQGTNSVHEMLHVRNYDEVTVDDHYWSVAFLDQALPKRRAIDGKRLFGHCDILVIHDAYDGWDYDYPTFLPAYPYRYRDVLTPHSMACSHKPLTEVVEFVGSINRV